MKLYDVVISLDEVFADNDEDMRLVVKEMLSEGAYKIDILKSINIGEVR